MDAAALSAALKSLNEAHAKGQVDETLSILKKIQAEVKPTEDLLRATKAGNSLVKISKAGSAGVAELSNAIVNAWKTSIREQKEKRKREEEAGGAGDGEGDRDVKKIKAEDAKAKSSSPAAAATPDTKPTASAIKSATASSASEPQSTHVLSSKLKSERDIKPLPGKLAAPAAAADSAGTSAEPSRAASEEGALDTIDTTLKKPRNAKDDGVVGRIKADSAEPDTTRDGCVVVMYNALAGDSNAASDLLIERARDIEAAVYRLNGEETSNDYRAKIRSLFLNVKDKGNPGLRDRIVKGLITGDVLVSMSTEDMASASIRARNEKLAEENLFKAKAVGETDRSADEPMTTFVTCKNCNNRWKFS